MSGLGGILSISRRAGKLIGGADEVKSAMDKKEARLVMITSDASEKTLSEMKYRCDKSKTEMIIIPETSYDIAETVGKRYAILAVTDKGFSDTIKKKLTL